MYACEYAAAKRLDTKQMMENSRRIHIYNKNTNHGLFNIG